MLEPRRTRSVTLTRALGRTTAVATRWPATRRVYADTVRVTCGFGGAGAGVGVGGGVGVGVGGVSPPPPDGGGVLAVTVSTCETGGCPARVAETVGVPAAASV